MANTPMPASVPANWSEITMTPNRAVKKFNEVTELDLSKDEDFGKLAADVNVGGLGLVIAKGDEITIAKIVSARPEIIAGVLPDSAFARRQSPPPTYYAIIWHDGKWKRMRFADLAQVISLSSIEDKDEKDKVQGLLDAIADKAVYECTANAAQSGRDLIGKTLRITHSIPVTKMVNNTPTTKAPLKTNYYGFAVKS